jgi:NAD(P)H-hydrate epimerase
MREVDRRMTEEFSIDLLSMMENAGRNLAELVRRWFHGTVERRSIWVVAGRGNNGGGGLVAARHLRNWGAMVTVLLPAEPLSGTPEAQRRPLVRMGVRRCVGKVAQAFEPRRRPEAVVSSMVGYGLHGPPRGWVAAMIRKINAMHQPVFALDLPTGLDPTSGVVFDPCLRATATATLALPKRGLVSRAARGVTGRIYLVDIGVPREIYRQVGLDVGAIFSRDSLVRLTFA